MFERLYWSACLASQLRGQARYPFKSRTAIRRDQARRVQQMVAYAYRYVPYYRETLDQLGMRPPEFKEAKDLARLPILEREQLQRDPEYFVSTAQPPARYLRLRSGGSTGTPRTIYHDTRALFQNRAHCERERPILAQLIGKPWGYRQVSIGSPLRSSQEIGEFLRARSLTPPGMAIQRQPLSLLDPPKKNVALINDLQPEVLHSYGSYLEILFAYLQAADEPLHRPKVITYTSDGLSDAVRRLIEQEYHIPVLSTYQAIEALRIGFECEQHQGIHLNVDLYPVRIVDGDDRACSVGKSGDVVISNLVNRATVLLNYRLGDVAAFSPTPCSCGRSLPLLAFPQGRSDDWIEVPGGKIIHPQAIRVIFTRETQVWQYQVVQQTETHFHVALVAAEACDPVQTSARIAERFTRTFGPDVTVDIAFVEAIPRTATGKVRPVLALENKQAEA